MTNAAITSGGPPPPGVLRGLATALVKRLLATVSVVLGAATLGFVALQLLPGDPVDWLIGPSMSGSPALRARVRREYGFDRPVIEQYLRYLGNLVHGRLGE